MCSITSHSSHEDGDPKMQILTLVKSHHDVRNDTHDSESELVLRLLAPDSGRGDVLHLCSLHISATLGVKGVISAPWGNMKLKIRATPLEPG